jgi:hypothetical protein
VTRILAISDEVEEALYNEGAKDLRPDLVLACGDVPLLYVPGNHDPELPLRDRRRRAPDPSFSALRQSFSYEPARPSGCISIDGRIVDEAGLRVAGLGGCLRYRSGPNQFTDQQMRYRALYLEFRSKLRRWRDGKGIDVFVSHAPPLGVGDGDDPAHRGFQAFHRLLDVLSPRLMVHGHVHLYGSPDIEKVIGNTRVANVVGHKLLEA